MRRARRARSNSAPRIYSTGRSWRAARNCSSRRPPLSRCFPADAGEPGILVANAEAALRDAAKQNVPLRFYNADMNARVAESLRLESRLRRALANDELLLWYQPKICVRTGSIVGDWLPPAGLPLPGNAP